MEIITKAVEMFFGNKKILKGIDFKLNNKEFLGIIGPNGSGKSTFLKCVYRVLKPTGGEIYFDGKCLDEMSYRESALRLAVVAQHNFYSFDFSVGLEEKVERILKIKPDVLHIGICCKTRTDNNEYCPDIMDLVERFRSAGIEVVWGTHSGGVRHKKDYNEYYAP